MNKERFVHFINDLCDTLTRTKPILYADDIILYISGKNTDELIEGMQEDMLALNTWCCTNHMTENTEKI